MSDSSNLKPFLLSTLSFMGGVAAGFLLAPEKGVKNRNWISYQLKNWVTRSSHDHERETNIRYDIYELRHQIQEGIQQNIPDAYEATEYIPLSNNELLHG